ncbi:MAG: nucleotidyltransferase domain-containing protein [Nanoarchaeota archaeon]
METIFKPGYERILRIFYENPSKNFYLREIARKTKINENGTSRFLKDLEKKGILKSKLDGNLKRYYLTENQQVNLIFSSFDIERINKLPSLRSKALYYFIEKLSEKPVFAVLFGSTANGNFTKESDIDILLIVNNKIDVKDAEKYVNAQTGMRINTFIIPYNNFLKELKLKEDMVIQSAINTGYPIINHIYYHEVINGSRRD